MTKEHEGKPRVPQTKVLKSGDHVVNIVQNVQNRSNGKKALLSRWHDPHPPSLSLDVIPTPSAEA